MSDVNEIILYQPDTTIRLDVAIADDTVWLTQEQIALLFGVNRPAITKHLGNIFKTKELIEKSVCSILERTATDGKRYRKKFYNLDAIISVGYRVNSINATKFRKWATSVLREYMLRGYAVHDRFERLERRMEGVEEKVDFFVKTTLPPIEGIFYEGQIFDAYKFAGELVRFAKRRIVLIDNYVDENVLGLLAKRRETASAMICTVKISKAFQMDLDKHNKQYPHIIIKKTSGIHDRFLIIDNDVYHIGASLKDLGKKLFAFSKMHIDAKELLDRSLSMSLL